jgi:quercetin dioxygenase-like cupin family protein
VTTDAKTREEDANMTAMEDFTVAASGDGRPRFSRSRFGWAALGLAAVASLSLYAALHRQGAELAAAGHDHGAMLMEAAGAKPDAQAGRPTTIVRPVSCQKLPNVLGKSITTVIVDFPPAAFTPQHRHPGSVTAFVLKGTLRSQLAGGPAETFAAGQTWFEPPGAIHVFAENASAAEPAQLLAIFVADNDCGPLLIPD